MHRVLAALVLTGSMAGLAWAAQEGAFLKRAGTDLLLKGKPLRLVSVNKYDLFVRYVKGGEERAQAKAALEEAAGRGFTAVRFNGGGFWPTDMKDWHRQEFWWGAFDALAADAKGLGIGLIPVVNWNTYLFPDMAGECVQDMLTDTDSRSWQYVELYARQLAGRYKDDDTVLFWELSNELNLGADLGPMRPHGWSDMNWRDLGAPFMRLRRDNYTSDQMNGYAHRLASLIRAVDKNHLISTGYSAPRAAAQHMRHQKGEMDWTQDSLEELTRYMRDTHADPIDLISVHFYSEHDNTRFGNKDPLSAGPLKQLKEAADRVGKPVYIGETGDDYEKRPDVPFLKNVLDEARRLGIALTLVWNWDSPGDKFSVSPTATPRVVELMEQANRR